MKIPSLRLLVSGLALGLAAPLALATTYYVDSGAAGNDSNNGTSTGTPWKTVSKVNGHTFAAGDSILFVRGGSWTATLHPLGSGSSAAPITVDAYGSGAAPLIQGGGASEAVLLSDQQYWDIKNLEVTNHAGADGQRSGVHIAASDFGTVHRIHLVDLEVHDVTGDPAVKNTGGIFFEITGSTTATKFDDVLIDGCYVHDLTRTGINLDSSWSSRTATDNGSWVPSTNVVISNNVIAATEANGMIWRVSSAPLIENNLWANCANPGDGNAMFVFNCDNAVIQNNEAYGTVFNTGDLDAGGFDADYACKGTIIQYNYSHDNGLGGIVAVGPNSSFNQNAVVRYNILQDNFQEEFRVSGHTTNASFYNNTVYIGSGLSNIVVIHHKLWDVWPSGTSYRNNIIYDLCTSSSYNFGSSTGNTFDYNHFYSQHPASEPSDAHKLTSDPKLVSPGSGGNGNDTVNGYMLQASSPAIGTGTLISGNGGSDYFGNAVSGSAAPNRGAYNGGGGSGTITAEFESLTVAASSGDTTTAIADAQTSGGQWLKYAATGVNDFITFSLTVPAGTYQIQVKAKDYTDRGIVQLATSGDGTSFFNKDGAKDFYTATATYPTITYTTQVTFPSTGTKYFRFTVTGKNASSSGYVVPLDALILTPQ